MIWWWPNVLIMHPHYGSNHLLNTPPPPMTSIMEMEAMPAASSDMNIQSLPPFDNAAGTVPLSSNLPDVIQSVNGAQNIYPSNSVVNTTPPYQFLPPMSTAVTQQSTPIFRSPTQVNGATTSNFQFYSPTHSVPPIQMTAPMNQPHQLTFSTWNNSVPTSISWIASGPVQKTSPSRLCRSVNSNSSNNRSSLLDR